MRYQLKKEAGLPAYLQLYYMLRDDIVSGVYRTNEKLPSKRVLAAETGISTVTVEHAYALLTDEGYIEPHERSGYFVVFNACAGYYAPQSGSVLHERPPAETDELAFPISVLKKVMRTVLNDCGEAILCRPPNAGCLELREAIRDYLKRSRGISAVSEQIIIGAGSEYLYGLTVGLLGHAKTYAIETPSYNKIEQVYLASRANIVKLPLCHDGIRSDALLACTADVLHISPYRSYPSGVTASASKRHEYLSWAKCGYRYIIEDDFESEFSVSKKPEETLFSLSMGDNVIYLNTFSKTISPAFRVGYAVLPKHLTEAFSEKIGFYSCTVSTYIQMVLAELISRGDFERHINRVRRRKRRDLLTGQ